MQPPDPSRSQQRSALYEHAPGFIATTEGPQHRFTFANESYLRFVGRSELLGLTVAEALPEVVGQGIIALLDDVYRTGQPFVGSSMALKMRNPGSGELEERCIDCVYQPMRDASGTVTGLFCEGYDVTERQAANEALAEVQSQMIYVARINAMGTMAATLAHELNQPLSAIGNYLSGVRLREASEHDPGRMASALRGIDEAYQRATGILRHLRDLTTRRTPSRSTFLVLPAVNECVRLVRPSASPETRFIVDIPDDLTMTADRVQIQQVVINLLLNACEAMLHSERGEVTVAAQESAQGVMVSVADTGTGVSPAEVETIFSWSYSSKPAGMGLGLSISRTILDMHRGEIWLERNEAEGAEFRFCVPQPDKAKPRETGCSPAS